MAVDINVDMCVCSLFIALQKSNDGRDINYSLQEIMMFQRRQKAVIE